MMKTTKRFLLTLATLFALTAGVWAEDDPVPIDLTKSTTEDNTWTFTMPAYDVELEVEYCPAATATAPTAVTGDLTYTASAQTLFNPGTSNEGTLMYKVTSEATQPTNKDGFSETIAQQTNAGTYYLWYYVKGDNNHTDTDINGTSISKEIGKKAPAAAEFDYTAPADLAYDGTTKSATVVAKTDIEGMGAVTLKYYKGETEITEPTAAGTYTVKISVAEGDNYAATTDELTDASWTFTIGEALPIDLTSTDGKVWTLASMPAYDVDLEIEYYPAATLTTAPTSIGEVNATGSAQTLVTGGVANGGSFEYALGTDDQTAPTEGWTATVPEASAPATYYVWYKVVGDDEHSDCETAPACVTATIKGFPVTVAAREYITYYSNMALMLDPSETDAKLYTISAVGTETATATEITSANAEMPFLIYNGATTEKTILLIPTTDAADNVTAATEFKGTLDAAQIAASTSTQNNYAFNGKEFVWVKNAIDIAANKCWLEVPVTASAGARALTIVFGDTTDINEALRVKSEESADGDWYDLNGRKLQAAPKRKGVYIHNGRKEVVK